MTRPFRFGGHQRYAHQRRGLRRLIQNRGVAALLFDPGTGKTAPTLDYASLLALKSPRGEARVLVLAPLAALDTWPLQAELWCSPDVSVWAETLGGSTKLKAEALAARGGNPFGRSPERPPKARSIGMRRSTALYRRNPVDADSVVPDHVDAMTGPRLLLCCVNYDAFAGRTPVTKGGTRTTADLLVEAVKRFDPDLIVADESHRLKGPTSKTSRAISRLTALSPRRVILTGTVMPHSPLDVFAQWRFLDPEAFSTPTASGPRSMSWGRFRDRYAKLGGYMGKQVTGFQRLDEMQEIMGRYAEVATKAEALDLPPTNDVIVPVHLSPAERKAYDSMKSQLATAFDSGELATAPNRLTQMMRLRQITSGYLPDDTGIVREVGRSKVATATSVVHDTLAGESRVVVFAHFRPEIERLTKALAKKGTEVLTITGDTSSRERIASRRRFGSGDPARLVMVAQIRTMSLAVNELVTSSNAVFVSASLQRDDMLQARDRLNRIGQTGQHVTFWYVEAPGTVDEVIRLAQRDRTDLETAIISHIRGGG